MELLPSSGVSASRLDHDMGMKILMVTIFPPEVGGPATQAAHLCQALRDRRYVPVVVAFDRNKTYIDNYNGIKTYRLCLTRWSHNRAITKFANY